MAQKVQLYNEDREIEHSLLKNIVISIAERYAKEIVKNKEKYYSLDITPYEEIMYCIFDIYEFKGNKLFGRLSKQHPNNTYVSHDYKTYDGNEIFPANASELGIENYTFAYLDYSLGIIGIVSALGAPGEKAFEDLFLKFGEKDTVKLLPIPNTNAIDEIYKGSQSEIARIEIEVPLPNPDVLCNIFGWNEHEIYDVLDCDNLVTSVSVKSKRRGGKIAKGSFETKTLMDAIYSMLSGYTKAKMKAQSETVKMQEFNLFETKFSYPIDITNYHIEQGERVFYTIREMVEQYKQNLAQSFNANYKILKKITGR